MRRLGDMPQFHLLLSYIPLPSAFGESFAPACAKAIVLNLIRFFVWWAVCPACVLFCCVRLEGFYLPWRTVCWFAQAALLLQQRYQSVDASLRPNSRTLILYGAGNKASFCCRRTGLPLCTVQKCSSFSGPNHFLNKLESGTAIDLLTITNCWECIGACSWTLFW